MKTIIIPTDFSAAALNAVHYGVAMAQHIGASIMLFHAYQVPISYTDPPLLLVSIEDLQQQAINRIEELKTEVQNLAPHINVYTQTELGNTVDEVEKLCVKHNPFAVIMGNKGGGGLENTLFGSTTLAAIKHITYPVICVPTGKTFAEGIKKIAFACDFKNVIQSTPAPQIVQLVKTFNASLYVLNVHKHHTPLTDTKKESSLLETMLQECTPEYHFIENEDVQQGINNFCELNNIDLLITIPKKHSIMHTWFSHSESKDIISHAHIPVLCMHE